MTIVPIMTSDQISKFCHHLLEKNPGLTDPIDDRDINLTLSLVRRVDHMHAETRPVNKCQDPTREERICAYGGRLRMLTSCCTKEKDAVIRA